MVREILITLINLIILRKIGPASLIANNEKTVHTSYITLIDFILFHILVFLRDCIFENLIFFLSSEKEARDSDVFARGV